jgi:hypothetical protein
MSSGAQILQCFIDSILLEKPLKAFETCAFLANSSCRFNLCWSQWEPGIAIHGAEWIVESCKASMALPREIIASASVHLPK